jgi:hypothetical protein
MEHHSAVARASGSTSRPPSSPSWNGGCAPGGRISPTEKKRTLALFAQQWLRHPCTPDLPVLATQALWRDPALLQPRLALRARKGRVRTPPSPIS